MNIKLIATDNLSKVNKKVIDDFNTLTDSEFLKKYSGSKEMYLKRFIKYGDPYMNAPLARIGKFLKRLN